MRKLLLLTAATLAMVAPALADAIVATATLDGNIVAIEASANGSLNVNNQAFGTVFNLNSLSVNSQTFLASPDILSTNTLDVNQNVSDGLAHTLVLDIVATGLTGPGAVNLLLSSFSVTGMTQPNPNTGSTGWTAREQTFINGNLLADTGVFTQTSDSAFSFDLANLTNPFTAAVRYTITTDGTLGRFNGGIDISGVAAVPGPIVGAGLPGILAAFGMGGLWWKRRKAIG
jgi:hypothetical protein